MKTCSKCKVEKELSEYYKDNKKPDGLRYECKDCKKKQLRDSYYKYREERLAAAKEKYKAAKANK